MELFWRSWDNSLSESLLYYCIFLLCYKRATSYFGGLGLKAECRDSRIISMINFDLNLPPFSLLRDFSFQNTSEHFAIRFRQSYLIWEVCDVTAIELSSKE